MLNGIEDSNLESCENFATHFVNTSLHPYPHVFYWAQLWAVWWSASQHTWCGGIVLPVHVNDPISSSVGWVVVLLKLPEVDALLTEDPLEAWQQGVGQHITEFYSYDISCWLPLLVEVLALVPTAACHNTRLSCSPTC